MNKAKQGSSGKLIAFFLVALVLLFAFGFAADGWQSNTNSDPDSGKVDGKGDEADENTDGNTPSEPEIYIPEYVNYLTGLETTEESSRHRPICFAVSSTAPLYGISGAGLVVEVPVENGETRLLVFTDKTERLGKIGSLTESRGYISNVAKYFGAVIVANGEDDTIAYDSCDLQGSYFDTEAQKGYAYTEYSHFVYTNGDLIEAGLANASINTAIGVAKTLPYTFTDFGASPVFGKERARTVCISYSETSGSELYYSDATGKYSYSKGGMAKVDLLSDASLSYDNVFVLFADTVTYESAEASEMIMSTTGSGVGYYMSGGTKMNIRWEATRDGNMTFYDENGSRLVVNRGTSYISYMKSSKIADVKIS